MPEHSDETTYRTTLGKIDKALLLLTELREMVEQKIKIEAQKEQIRSALQVNAADC